MSCRGWTRAGASAALAGLLSLSLGVLAPAASAAPADAAGTALRVALNAQVGPPPGGALVTADGTVASVTAPPDSSESALDVAAALGGSVGVTAVAGLASASATSTPAQSQGQSDVAGLALSILGSPTTAAVLSGQATCPTDGSPAASTIVTNLSVLGQAIVATVNGPTVTVSAGVTVAGFTDATLTAAVQTRLEQTTGTTATAIALRITYTLHASLTGFPITIPVGTIEAGHATCEAPLVAPAAPTATGLDPTSGPTRGDTPVTVTGSGFVPDATSVTIGGLTLPASQVRVTGPTTLTFDTPAHPAGRVEVTVTTPDGTTAAQTYTYLAPAAPTATGLDPTSGPTRGDTPVTVTGSGFVPGATSVTASDSGSLPATGAPSALPLVIALLLLASGVLLVVGSGRRA
jgi:hypothetical protein